MTTVRLPRWRRTRSALLVSAAARTLLGVLVLLLLASVAPALAGWETTVVMSGSMAPTISPGDVAVVRPVDTADLRPGQLLLVDDPDTPGRLRLHRLVAVQPGGLQLKGDANPTADSALVAPGAVHGVGALRLPALGRPVLWAAEGRWQPLAVTGAVLALVVAAAGAHRPDDDEQPGTPAGRGVPAAVLGGTAVLGGAAVLVGALVGGCTTGAVFSATTSNGADSFAAATYFTCASAVAGESAAQYLPMQESSGTTAANDGTFSTDGSYAGGVTYRVSGPNCTSVSRAVRLDGSSGYVWTPVQVASPATFSTQLWFNTSTSRGGYLIGFGNGTNGDTSSSKDRLVYLTDSGKLVFGVYNGAVNTVTSSASYNDGSWHLVTATFSRGTGTRLYVDGALVAANASYTSAENNTGYFRAGYDSLSGWPNAPTSYYFAGSIAHMAVFPTALSAADVAAQYAAAG